MYIHIPEPGNPGLMHYGISIHRPSVLDISHISKRAHLVDNGSTCSYRTVMKGNISLSRRNDEIL